MIHGRKQQFQQRRKNERDKLDRKELWRFVQHYARRSSGLATIENRMERGWDRSIDERVDRACMHD